MPFKSKSQLRLCYAQKKWNCDKWLKETPSVCDLPERSRGNTKTRSQRKGEIVKGKLTTGPRGGLYFEIVEKRKDGSGCTVKVYVKK